MVTPKKKPKKSKLDSLIVITVLTSSAARRDQLDRIIDKAFAADARVQVIRVVGYTDAGAVARLAEQYDEVTGAAASAATEDATA